MRLWSSVRKILHCPESKFEPPRWTQTRAMLFYFKIFSILLKYFRLTKNDGAVLKQCN